MKIKPEIYASALVSSVNENNMKNVVEVFWRKLQKNGQYKDLPKIILALDKEYAKQSGKVLAQVYSGEALDKDQLETIKNKLKSRFDQEVIVNNIVNPDQTAGLIVKVDDTEINLSLENKINRLKNVFNSDNS